MAKITRTFRLEKDLVERFDKVSEETGISKTFVITEAIINFVNKYEEEIKMKKLNYTKMNGLRYQLPEGFYAIDTRFGDQVYNEHGENVTQKIMGNANGDGYIILTDKGIVNLELLN